MSNDDDKPLTMQDLRERAKTPDLHFGLVPLDPRLVATVKALDDAQRSEREAFRQTDAMRAERDEARAEVERLRKERATWKATAEMHEGLRVASCEAMKRNADRAEKAEAQAAQLREALELSREQHDVCGHDDKCDYCREAREVADAALSFDAGKGYVSPEKFEAGLRAVMKRTQDVLADRIAKACDDFGEPAECEDDPYWMGLDRAEELVRASLENDVERILKGGGK